MLSSVQFYKSMMRAEVKLDFHDNSNCAHIFCIVLLISFLTPWPLPFTILEELIK